MLFAPKEIQDDREKRQQSLADYRGKLHEIAMRDSLTTDQLQRDKELSFLVFEGILMGHLDGKSETVIKTVEHIHKRIGREVEKRMSKPTKEF